MKEKIELMLANVKATLEIEGFVVLEEETEILRQYLKEELTEENGRGEGKRGKKGALIIWKRKNQR